MDGMELTGAWEDIDNEQKVKKTSHSWLSFSTTNSSLFKNS